MSMLQMQYLKIKEFDFDDGIAIYELEFTAGGSEYEYDVHAVTGKSIKGRTSCSRPGSRGHRLRPGE